MGEWGNLQEIRDEMQQILDRIDTKLIERQEQQTPQQRERVFGRMVRGSVIVAAFVAAWRWIAGRHGQVAAVGAMGALGAMLIVGPPAPDSGPYAIPETHRPLPWDVMPPVDRMAEPDVSVSAMVTPEPTTEPAPEQAGQSAPDVEPSAGVSAESAPSEPFELPESESEPGPTAEPSPAESPEVEPEPTPEPTEPPYTEREARELCLDLDKRPVVELGVCIRHLLGIE